jgi:hypothetical protein
MTTTTVTIETQAAEALATLDNLAGQYLLRGDLESRDNLRGEILCIDEESDGGESLLLAYGGPTEWLWLHQDGSSSYHNTWVVDGAWAERSCVLTADQVRIAQRAADAYRVAERDAA